MACPKHLRKQGYKWNKKTKTCEYIDPNTGASRGVKGKRKDKKVILKVKI